MGNKERFEVTKAKLIQCLGLLTWSAGGVQVNRERPGKVAVELVFHTMPKILLHHGVGISRWEIWVRRDWIERVLEPGLACFPEHEILTLDAKPVPLLRPAGSDECYQLVAARGSLELSTGYFAVTVGGVAGAAHVAPLLAMSRAVMKWEAALGIKR